MRSKIFGGCALAALALAACSQQNAGQSASSQPLAPPSPAETAPAPAATALPPAPSAPVRYAPPARRYTALNDAYAMSKTYADAPPDYAFDYDGDAPEAWGSRDGVVRVGERVPGGWRYYYYQPGSDTPYLVRDPEYAYGFDGGQLAVIYDARGRALPPEYADRQAWLAGRYLSRARGLWRAAREHRRLDVEAQVWREQQADQERQRRYWDETRNADPDWRAYHDEHEGEARDHWAQIAAAWAASQFANQQQQGWEHHREGGVDEARQAWRARMAQQGPGPAQPPSEGWNGRNTPPGQPGQPQGWNGQPPQGQWNGRPPQGQWNGQPPQSQWNGQPPQDQWRGHPPQDQWHSQPPQGQWNGHAPQGQWNGQPPQGQWNGRQAQWNGRPGEPQPQPGAHPGGQGWAGGPSASPAQQQAEADRQRQLQAQQQAQAERQHQLQAQQQAQAERQHQLQAQQQAQAERQHQLQAQQQAQAERQHQLQAQQQAQADRQHQLQAQQQAQADHQHQVQAQQQAQAAHAAKPQDQGPPAGKALPWHDRHGPSSQPPHQP